MAPVIEVTRETLLARRTEILGSLDIADYEEFRRRLALGLLSDAEWAELDELEAIAFLLGDDVTE